MWSKQRDFSLLETWTRYLHSNHNTQQKYGLHVNPCLKHVHCWVMSLAFGQPFATCRDIIQQCCDVAICAYFWELFYSGALVTRRAAKRSTIPIYIYIYIYKEENRELIFSSLSWLAVLLVSAYARRWRRGNTAVKRLRMCEQSIN